MIGVLCNQKYESIFADNVHILFKSANLSTKDSMFVFTMADIDLSHWKVCGREVSDDGIKKVEGMLPSVIINLSVQYNKDDIKKMRALIDSKDMSIINTSNQYNQCAIMDILAANSKTSGFALPYVKYQGNENLSESYENCNLIIKPESKASLNKIAYIRQSKSGPDVSCWLGRFCCQTNDFLTIISSIAPSQKWILLKTPNLKSTDGQLLVMRVYLQRRFNGEWTVIMKNIQPSGKNVHFDLYEKAEAVSLQMINYINCFIRDIGICYIDFVFDNCNSPYFLNLGGYDNTLLDKDQNKYIRISFFKNMLEYTRGFVNKPKGVFKYVD